MIHVTKNGRQEGPFREEEVRQKISKGEFALTDLGWKPGLANWIALGEILGEGAPPPLPAPASASAISPKSGGTTPTTLAPGFAATMGILLFVLILGLLGAFFDMYTAGTLFHGVDAVRSDYSAFASEHPLLAFFVGVLFPEIRTNADQAIGAIRSAALLLLVCGLIGALFSILLVRRRHVRILAVLLIICGIAPMFHHLIEFAGLPMAVAGSLALFVKQRRDEAAVDAG